MRVIVPGGPPAADGSRKIGLEIELEPGWKTYWREPGDAGVPPYFDHSASANVAALDIDWPAPHRFVDGSGMSIGYKNTVVLPITVKPESTALPVLLSLSVEYGVCREICVPATGTARIMLPRTEDEDSEAKRTLDRFSTLIPTEPTADLAVTEVAGEDGKALVVRSRLADPKAPSDLFVEGPENWYFPAPKLETVADGIATWRVALDGGPKDKSLKGSDLTFTLVNGDKAVEQNWHLD